MPSLSNSITTSGSDSIVPQPPKRIKVKTLHLPERWLVIPTFTNTVAQLSCYIRTRLSLDEDVNFDIYLDGSLIVPEETIEVVRDGDSIHVYPSGQEPPSLHESREMNPSSQLDDQKRQSTTQNISLPPKPPGRHPPIQLLFSQNNGQNDELASNSQGPVSATVHRTSTSHDDDSKPRRLRSAEAKKRRNVRNRFRARRKRQAAREARAAHQSSATEHEPSVNSAVPVSQNPSSPQPEDSPATLNRTLSETDASKVFKDAAKMHTEEPNEQIIREKNHPASGSKRDKDLKQHTTRRHETRTKDVKKSKEKKVVQKGFPTIHRQHGDTVDELLEEETEAHRSSRHATGGNKRMPQKPFNGHKRATISLPEVIDLLSDDDEAGKPISQENETPCSIAKEENVPIVEGTKERYNDIQKKAECDKDIFTGPESASGQPMRSRRLYDHDSQSKSLRDSIVKDNAEQRYPMTEERSRDGASMKTCGKESGTEILGVGPTMTEAPFDCLNDDKPVSLAMEPIQASKAKKTLESRSHGIAGGTVRSTESVPSISIAASEIQAATQLKPVGNRTDKTISSDLSAAIDEIVKVLDKGGSIGPTSQHALGSAEKVVLDQPTDIENQNDGPGRGAFLSTEEAYVEKAVATAIESPTNGKTVGLDRVQPGKLRHHCADATNAKQKSLQCGEHSPVLKEQWSMENVSNKAKAAEKPSEDAIGYRESLRHSTVLEISKKRKVSDCHVGNTSYDTSGRKEPLVRKKQRQDPIYDFSHSPAKTPVRTLPPKTTNVKEHIANTGELPKETASGRRQSSFAATEYISELLEEILDFHKNGCDSGPRSDRTHVHLVKRMNHGEANELPTRSDITSFETKNHRDLCAVKKATLANLHEVAGHKELIPVENEHELQSKDASIVNEDRSNCTPIADGGMMSKSASRKRRRKFSSVSSALRYARENDMLQDTNAIKSRDSNDFKKACVTNGLEGKPAKRRKQRKSRGKYKPEHMLDEEQHNESVLLGFDDCINHEPQGNAYGSDECLLPPLSLLESTVDMRDPALFISNDTSEPPKSKVLYCPKVRPSPEREAPPCPQEKSVDVPPTSADATEDLSPHGPEHVEEVPVVFRGVSGMGKSLDHVITCDELDLDGCRKDNARKRNICLEERTEANDSASAKGPPQADYSKCESAEQAQRSRNKSSQRAPSEANGKRIQGKEGHTSSEYPRCDLQSALKTKINNGEQRESTLSAPNQLADGDNCVVNIEMSHEPDAKPNKITTIVEPNLEVEEDNCEEDRNRGKKDIMAPNADDAIGSKSKFPASFSNAPETPIRYEEKEKFFDDVVSLMINTTVELEFLCKKLFSLKNKEEKDECAL